MRAPLLLAAAFALLCASQTAARAATPSQAFDLHAWKLQIPGPLEVKALRNYSSAYFDLSPEKEMCFHLDASEKGATRDAHYVRSELRHLLNWNTGESHSMSAEVRAVSHLTPDKITVLQIHGINPDGSDAPPLLRIAVNKGDLVAMLKTDSSGSEGESVPLVKGLGSDYAKVEVSVKSKELKISVNGVQKVMRNLGFWKYMNYFKAGCYPQSTEGTVDVMFRSLSAH
jgi:hypothetical protein